MIRPLVFELMQNGLRVRQLDDFPRLNQQHLDSFVILMKNNDFELRYVSMEKLFKFQQLFQCNV